MNCTESQELLVDLAYGELEPEREAQMKEHLASCVACRAEQAQLEEARKLTSSLRELEEPSANFDEPILRAARAEAGMQADGTPGPVVEVAATVKPLGLQAARLDPHAKVRGSGQRAPWWRRRAAMAGSIAAAAAIAVAVVSVSLTSPRQRNAETEVAPIAVRAPNAVVPEALKDSLARNDKAEPATAAPPASNSFAGSRSAAPPVPERKAAPAQDAAAPKFARRSGREDQAGSGLDTAGGYSGGVGVPAKDGKAKVAEAERDRGETPKKASPPLSPTREAPAALADHRMATSPAEEGSLDRPEHAVSSAPAVAAPAAARADGDQVASQTTPISAPEITGSVPAGVMRGAAASAAPAKNRALPEDAKQAPVRSADVLENAASVARRAGDYATAAGLYRQAAAMRKESDPQNAAWDLAHAVECLAAGGNVGEAVAVRKELLRSFPDQQGPRAAANSALRFVPLPNDEAPAGK